MDVKHPIREFREATPKKRRRVAFGAVSVALIAAIVVWHAADAWATAREFYQRLTILSTIITIASQMYVDQVDPAKLVDGAIDGALSRLDPHCNYLSPEQAARFEDRMRGNFGGVGIYYSVIDGTPTVMSIVEGGPAQNAGVATGDRIVDVDGHTTLGWRDAQVQDALRGPIGTNVTVSIMRAGEPHPFEVKITRGLIPLKSVPYAFMLDDSTGYIRISNFASTTGDEVGNALRSLTRSGMRDLILDLRDNGGGELAAAVAVANYFLPEGTTIVTQKGRWEGADQAYYATAGSLKIACPIVVLINHGSASASEIVSGALQDTDRGIIVGQRSFGKGLVQRQFDLSRRVQGGGVLLLTIARYYTPTGRLIQRDYSEGKAQYLMEGFSAEPTDTVPGPAFHTPLGRVVYGGGGIRPDFTIPQGRIGALTARLSANAVFFRFAGELVRGDANLPRDFPEFQSQFRVDDVMYGRFIAFAEHVDPEVADSTLRNSRTELTPYIAAGVAGRKWGTEARYRMLAPYDPELASARLHLSDAAELLARAAAREN